MEYDSDVIVIGSGAGGAAFARACAMQGRTVILLERGAEADANMRPFDEQATLIDKAPYDDRDVEVNRTPLRLYMGGVLGGGTAVFGGAMLRPSAYDFEPGRYYGERIDRSIWEWPLSYEELQGYFREAEELYRVSGTVGDSLGPLPGPSRTMDAASFPLAPINERLVAANRTCGLHPFRLPLAIDTGLCSRCDSCAGFLCPYGARRSAADLLSDELVRTRLTVIPQTDVLKLETCSREQIAAVHLLDRRTGKQRRMTARCFALAAGAIGSPAIMLRSGLNGTHVGRNYMMHYSPIVAGVFTRPTEAHVTFVKQVGIADYYFGTPEYPFKMGLVQSLPAPGPLMMKKSGLRHVPDFALRLLRSRMLPLAGIVEDLPSPRNRVFLKANGTIAVQHDFSDFDRQRGRALGRAMCGVLKRTGARFCSVRDFPSREHVAHQCGTLRMARGPRDGVVDRDCRVFGRRNLFVVDGSVLPTSLGVGPSLTIVANALRVARIAAASV